MRPGGPSRGDSRRPGVVYAIPIRDPDTGEVRADYVGQTRQRLSTREAQHRGFGLAAGRRQPWDDLIAGPAYVLESGSWTDAELDAREAHHIRRLKPRYPYEHNLDNPHRIPIPVARRQRAARDRRRRFAVGATLPAARTPRPRPVRQAADVEMSAGNRARHLRVVTGPPHRRATTGGVRWAWVALGLCLTLIVAGVALAAW